MTRGRGEMSVSSLGDTVAAFEFNAPSAVVCTENATSSGAGPLAGTADGNAVNSPATKALAAGIEIPMTAPRIHHHLRPIIRPRLAIPRRRLCDLWLRPRPTYGSVISTVIELSA